MSERKKKPMTKAKLDEGEGVGQSEESKAKTEQVKADTDDLLDAIDELLPETEAESQAFVESFVQKGGQ